MSTDRFIGGLRILPEGTTTPRVRLGHVWENGSNATIPLAELLIDDQRVLLRLRWVWVRRFSRVVTRDQMTWEAPRDIVSAEAFPREGLTRGLLLSASGRPPAIFWCFDQTQRAVLTALHTQEAA